MDEEEFDIGNNLTGLGWGYLFFKYVFPVILGLIAIIGIIIVGIWFLHFVVSVVPAGGGYPAQY